VYEHVAVYWPCLRACTQICVDAFFSYYKLQVFSVCTACEQLCGLPDDMTLIWVTEFLRMLDSNTMYILVWLGYELYLRGKSKRVLSAFELR